MAPLRGIYESAAGEGAPVGGVVAVRGPARQDGRGDPGVSGFCGAGRPEQRGNRADYRLTDHESRKCISIGLWETEADMTATKASGAYQQRLAMLKDVFAEPPAREGYEVSVEA